MYVDRYNYILCDRASGTYVFVCEHDSASVMQLHLECERTH